MGKLVLYATVSLDGYRATPDGKEDWHTIDDGYDDDFGFSAFFEKVGAIVMDHATYNKAHALAEWPYGDKPAYVLTDHQPEGGHPHVDFVMGSVEGFIEWLRGDTAGDIWLVAGTHAISEFNALHAIDAYRLTIHPMLLGDGLPLFEKGLKTSTLKVLETRAYDNGLLQLHYETIRS